MKFYWNTDSREVNLVYQASVGAARYATIPIDLFFTRNPESDKESEVAYLLPEGSVIHAVLKPSGIFNSNTALAVQEVFEAPLVASDPYVGLLDLNTIPIKNLFTQRNNPESIDCNLVFLYQLPDEDGWNIGPRISLQLENAVATGYEGAPVPLPNGIAWGEITGTLSSQTDLWNALQSKIETIVPGSGVSVDNTDPRNPIVSATVAGGTVTQVNTGTGLTGGPITGSGTVQLSAASISSLALADSALQNITGLVDEGSNITITGSGTTGDPYVINAPPSGGGTVSSVGLLLPDIFEVTGSPVTTSGTLTGSLAEQSANLVFAGPSAGGDASPTFRQLGYSELSGLPTLGDLASQDTVDLETQATGILPAANGGFGRDFDPFPLDDRILFWDASANQFNMLEVGDNLSITGDVLDATFDGSLYLEKSQNLSDLSNASTARVNLGLAIGTNVQAYDAGLQSISGLTTAANNGIYTTGSDTYATYSLTAGGRALGGVAGTANTIPYFSASNTVSLLTTTTGGRALLNNAGTANTFPYYSASNTVSLSGITATGRLLANSADAAAARTTISAIGGSTGATDNVILRSDGAGGSTLQDSLVTINDFGGLFAPAITVTSGSIGFGTFGSDTIFTPTDRWFRFTRFTTSGVKIELTNNWVSDSNYEAGVLDFRTTTNVLRIGSDVGSGGGTARDVHFIRGGVVQMEFEGSGVIDLPATSATAEVVVSDATIPIKIGGVTYKILLKS